LTAATDATTVLGLAFLLWRWQARRRMAGVGDDDVSKHEQTFAGLVVAGVLANAIVCGALASPADRFQARVIWLIPLLAVGMAPRPADHQLPSVQL
jgi:formate/nitrite transporter FocA (FNT family)